VVENGFTAVNDSTFQLRLIRPFHPILGILSMQYCSVVPREVVDKYGKDFRSHPCGTGPFQFHFWEEGQALVLYKNPHYFEKDKIVLNKHPYLNTEYFGILVDEKNELVKNSPLRLKALRQAINSSINRQKLMMYLRNSIGTAATAGMVPAGLPSKNAEMVSGY